MKALVKWLIFLVLAIFLIMLFMWSFVPGWVSRDLTNKAGVPVTISSVGVTPWSITISDFVMGNPRGSILPRALSIANTKAKASISRYFQEKIVIDEVTLNNIYLGLEFARPLSSSGNWTQIMNNFSRNAKSGKGKPVLIKKLIITNMDIVMAYRDNPNQPPQRLKSIRRMELNNVSSTEGLPVAAITNEVIGAMLFEVFKREGIQNMIQGIFSPSNEGGVFGGFKGLFGLNEATDREFSLTRPDLIETRS